jgi:hypothetical protein
MLSLSIIKADVSASKRGKVGFEVFKNTRTERNSDSKKYSVSIHATSRLYLNKGITDFFCENGVVLVSVSVDEKKKKIALEGLPKSSDSHGYTLAISDSGNRSSIFIRAIVRKYSIPPFKNVETAFNKEKGIFEFSYQ